MTVDIKLLATRLCPAVSQVIWPQTVVPQRSRHSSGNLIQLTKSYNINSVCLLSRYLVQKPTNVSTRNLFQSKNDLSFLKNNTLSLTLLRSLDSDRGLRNLTQPNAYICPRNFNRQKHCLSVLENNDDFPVTVFRPSNPERYLRNLIQQKERLSLLTDNDCFSLTLFHPSNPDRCLKNYTEPKCLSIINDSSSLTLFRPLNSDRRIKSLLQDTDSNKYLQGQPKTFFFRRRNIDENGKKPKKRIPKLILVQNPFTWFMTKIDFTILRSIWDPTFKEKEFKYGTQQAISKVTNVISDGQFTELNGLLTKAARLSLMRELDRNWSEKQRSLLSLDRNDIQITSPRKVYFIRIADKKYCDVDMAFLALKWVPINSIEALIFTEIFARFHREYTPHSIPEWTIAYFKVTRFEVLRRKPKA